MDLAGDVPCKRILSANDHYSVLGLARDAEETAIKTEFRKRAREVHPDKNSSPLAEEAFKRLQKAHETLSNPTSRRRYNISGDDDNSVSYVRRQPRYYHNGRYGDSTAESRGPASALFSLLFPLLFSVFVSFCFLASQTSVPGGGAFSKPPKQKMKVNSILHLTKLNADASCGVVGGKHCLVFLTKPTQSFGEREETLMKDLREEAGKSVKTSRGQSLPVTWATTPAVGKWPSLLPEGASLPWVVVLKMSRGGLRAAGLPVPAAGAKTKRRISSGVPPLLRDIAEGSARFDAVKFSVSDLFGR